MQRWCWPHGMFALVVGQSTNWNYPQRRLDMVEVSQLHLPWRSPFRAEFIGEVLWSLLYPALLFYSTWKEETRVRNPHARGYDNGLIQCLVLGAQEICTRVFSDRETKGCQICLWVEVEFACLNLYVSGCDSSGGNCYCPGGRGNTHDSSWQESTRAEYAVEPSEAKRQRWEPILHTLGRGHNVTSCRAGQTVKLALEQFQAL